MNVLAEMLLTEPAPALIWAFLILLTFPAVLLLGNLDGARHPRLAAREIVAALRGTPALLPETSSYADEVQVAADRAASGAQRWRTVWEKSEEAVSTSYQAWLDADARLRTAVAASAWGRPWSVRTCEEYAARERFLHRSVTEAVADGRLPATAAGHGWDATLHPVEQELVLARASVAWLREQYEQAVVAERTAWHDAELARRASISLTTEARAAALLPVPKPVTVAPIRRRVAIPAI